MWAKHNVRWAARKRKGRVECNSFSRAKGEKREFRFSLFRRNPNTIMKKRSAHSAAGHGPEFKGVVKKMAGKLTSNPALEEEGRAEMLGARHGPTGKPSASDGKRLRLNPDPHRRG